MTDPTLVESDADIDLIRDPEVAQWAASVLTQSWRSRLSENYPNYTFAIETLVDEDDVAVTFYRQMG